MNTAKPQTLGELRQTEWGDPQRHLRSIKDELRLNLICLLEAGANIFPGIIGFEETVVPQVINAVLARHNFILLGLRGQAKSRILRSLATLLDEEIPILAGSEVNDNPFRPSRNTGASWSRRRASAPRSCGSRATSALSKSSRRRT